MDKASILGTCTRYVSPEYGSLHKYCEYCLRGTIKYGVLWISSQQKHMLQVSFQDHQGMALSLRIISTSSPNAEKLERTLLFSSGTTEL